MCSESGDDKNVDDNENNQDTEDSDDEKENYVDDFDAKELEHDTKFISVRKIWCFDHTLQLVAQKFDELVKHIHKINSKVNS